MRVWPGDIRRLAVDAIVNAANTELLGCFRPRHACIDNAIHAAAGPRLREDCARIIAIQGHPERSGEAKITRAYHLPSRFVLHTVGPIVAGRRVQPEDERTLAAAYVSCLELARTMRTVRTLAFCAIYMNVRGGSWFLEEPYRPQMERWRAWFRGIPSRERLLLLDVGSGFNTPSVVRWPMERIALRDPEARLVRINLHHAELPRELGSRGVSVAAGARETIAAIATELGDG